MKFRRQFAILELIQNEDIETQEELASRLIGLGYDVTQATISRDIRELKLTKVAAVAGRQKYTVLNQEPNANANDRHFRVFRDGVASVDVAQHMIVVKTYEGMAMAVAASMDAMGLPELIGCIAGDNTIFGVAKDEGKALALLEKLNAVIRGG